MMVQFWSIALCYCIIVLLWWTVLYYTVSQN